MTASTWSASIAAADSKGVEEPVSWDSTVTDGDEEDVAVAGAEALSVT